MSLNYSLCLKVLPKSILSRTNKFIGVRNGVFFFFIPVICTRPCPGLFTQGHGQSQELEKAASHKFTMDCGVSAFPERKTQILESGNATPEARPLLPLDTCHCCQLSCFLLCPCVEETMTQLNDQVAEPSVLSSVLAVFFPRLLFPVSFCC